MKKKINISVADIVHKAPSTKDAPPAAEDRPTSTPAHRDKIIRFEDMYRKALQTSTHSSNAGSRQVSKIVYGSKKTTPTQSDRVNKHSHAETATISSYGTSLINSRKRSVASIHSQGAHSEANKENNKYNADGAHMEQTESSKPVRHSLKNRPNHTQKPSPVSLLYLDALCQLNHQQHCHLRERNQCFLSQNQIGLLMLKMGYSTSHPLYTQLLRLLEVDVYGGAPSDNLRQVLEVLEAEPVEAEHEPLPKIVDSNLRVHMTIRDRKIVNQYFKQFRVTKPSIKIQEQSKPMPANTTIPTCNSGKNSISNLHQVNDMRDAVTPNKKIANNAISELVEALTQSEAKKSERKQGVPLYQPEQQGCEQTPNQENLGTFRKVEPKETIAESEEYNFSRELSGQVVEPKEDQDLIDLKHKLNQALRKSQRPCLEQEHEYGSFLHASTNKYGSKPILSVDVNLGEGLSEKIIVYEGETAREVSERLVSKFGIPEDTRLKFEKMLDSHLSTMLWKIEELSEQMLTDRTERDLD